jgi:hypothetical protein
MPARKIFVNIPVENLDRSVDFFTQLGFSFDPRFTDETATSMVVSDEAFVMLLTKQKFQDFTARQIADTSRATEVILALSADSRDDVDALADKALAVGGSPANEPIDLGFMYSRSFGDPDGHLWEVMWMDLSAVEEVGTAAAAAS